MKRSGTDGLSNGTLRGIRDAARSRLWPIPALGIVLAVAAGILLPRLDRSVDANLPQWLDAVVFSGDADAARSVLSTIASSLITVTALTFSLTVVTLQLASSQFSPRLLRTFTRDLFVQVTLAILLATFTFSLTVLRSVRSAPDNGNDAAHVPDLAVTSAFLLTLASVIGLVLFLAHLTMQIRVETMLRTVHRDASETLRASLRQFDALPDEPQLPAGSRATIWAAESGFLVNVDRAALAELARASEAVVAIERQIGDFVVAATPLGYVILPTDTDTAVDLAERAAAEMHVGVERTAAQDIAYGLRQLTDVAIKALSPGINDPTTAIHALGHSSALLTELMTYELGPEVLRDDSGAVRVMIDAPSFAELLDLALTQPRRYGQADSQVLIRISELLRDLAWRAEARHHAAILNELHRVRLVASRQEFDDQERATLTALDTSIHDILELPPRAHHAG